MGIPNSKMMLVDKCKLINLLCCNNQAVKFFVKKMILNLEGNTHYFEKDHRNNYIRDRVMQ